MFSRKYRHQLDFGAGEVNRGRHQEQIADRGCFDDVLCRNVVDQEIVGGLFDGAAVDAKTACRVSLRVEIDKKHSLTLKSKPGSEVDGGRRLPNATFLIGDGDNGGVWHLKAQNPFNCVSS